MLLILTIIGNFYSAHLPHKVGAHGDSQSRASTHTHTHTHTRARARTRAHAHTHTHTHARARARTHKHTHARARARTHAHERTHARSTLISLMVCVAVKHHVYSLFVAVSRREQRFHEAASCNDADTVRKLLAEGVGINCRNSVSL